VKLAFQHFVKNVDNYLKMSKISHQNIWLSP